MLLHSARQDGLAALEALLEARSAAEKAKAAADGSDDRLEDLPAKLASLRSVPPAVRTTRPSNGGRTNSSTLMLAHLASSLRVCRLAGCNLAGFGAVLGGALLLQTCC
jgi:hypothetical protein